MGAYTHVCPRLETCMRNEDREVIVTFSFVAHAGFLICFQRRAFDFYCNATALCHLPRDAGLSSFQLLLECSCIVARGWTHNHLGDFVLSLVCDLIVLFLLLAC